MLVPMSTDQPNGQWSDSSYRKDCTSMSNSSGSRKGRGTSTSGRQSRVTKKVATASPTLDGEEVSGVFSNDQPPSVPIRTRESSSRSYSKETHKKICVLQEHLQQLSIMTTDVMSTSPSETGLTPSSAVPNQDGTMVEDAKAIGRMTSRGPPERGVQRKFSNSGGKKSARGREKFLLTNHNDVEERRPASRSRSKSRHMHQRRLKTFAIATADALPNPDDHSPGSSPPPPSHLRRSHTSAGEYGMQEPGHLLKNSSHKGLFTPRGMKKGTRQLILEARNIAPPPVLSRSVSTPLTSDCGESRSSQSQPSAGPNEKFGDISQKKLASRRSGSVPFLPPGEPRLKPVQNPPFGGNLADWDSDDDEES